MAVHLLGVRHHGPGSARAVVAALDALRPGVVLVEMPADATAALRWIGRDGLVPPVALLGYSVADTRRAAFAPLATFSPEWQAVAWANDRGVPVEAIDRPFSATLADAPASLLPVSEPVDPIGALAAAAGEPDAERWWEDHIEHRGEDAFEAVAEAMTAIRKGTVTSDDEERREAHMRIRIRAAAKEHDTVAVVCGAWHVPALDLDGAPTMTADRATLRGQPTTKVAVSWVPWSHGRLAAATGYAAGVVSPGWYQHVFRHPGPDGVARFFVDAAHLLRRRGLTASPDHLISATRMADALAALRGRPRPGLAEVLDAADSVMGGLPLIRRQLVVGTSIGSVPPDAPQVPLARNLAARQRSARLAPSPDEQRIELDLRTPNGRRRSLLLHQVGALGIPWGTVTEGRGSSGTFRETWLVAWEPDWAVRVVEAAADGTTLEQAAANRLIARAHRAATLGEIAAALEHALLGSLGDAIDPIVTELATRAAADPDIGDLMGALGPLAEAARYGDVRATDLGALRDVFDGLVVRVLAGLVPACASLDDDAAATMVERLGSVQQALALLDHPARRQAFPAVVEQLTDGPGHGRVHGRATRLLHDSGRWGPTQVEHRLGRALSGGTPPAAGAAFVEGFLAGSGTVLVHDDALRAVVDRWIGSLPPEAFIEVVPLLRRTFGAFEPGERRQIGLLVAGAERDVPSGFGPGVDEARAAAALLTVRHLLGLPVP